MAQKGLRADQADVQIGYLSAPQPRRRVQLLRADMEYPRTGRAQATTVLEWRDQLFEGEMEGESGSAIELRLAALATLNALSAVLAYELTFALIGIRAIRVFDRDLVVVSIHSEQEGADRPLLGTGLVTESLWHGTALAVLNASNRLLGNYLSTED